MKDEGFPKREHLVGKKQTEQLFVGGHSHSVAVFPIRLVYSAFDNNDEKRPTVQVMVSVSKRHFKQAVRRNRVKRQIREAYRRNKQTLISAAEYKQKLVNMAFVWQADRLYDSDTVESSVKRLLQQVAEKL